MFQNDFFSAYDNSEFDHHVSDGDQLCNDYVENSIMFDEELCKSEIVYDYFPFFLIIIWFLKFSMVNSVLENFNFATNFLK